nr:hypothetical protein HUO10_005066 [Paraburkholderia busanensis]
MGWSGELLQRHGKRADERAGDAPSGVRLASVSRQLTVSPATRLRTARRLRCHNAFHSPVAQMRRADLTTHPMDPLLHPHVMRRKNNGPTRHDIRDLRHDLESRSDSLRSPHARPMGEFMHARSARPSRHAPPACAKPASQRAASGMACASGSARVRRCPVAVKCPTLFLNPPDRHAPPVRHLCGSRLSRRS